MENIREKTIKDLELMAKRFKKRIAMLDSMGLETFGDMSNSIAVLMSEYRSIKKDIITISSTIGR